MGWRVANWECYKAFTKTLANLCFSGIRLELDSAFAPKLDWNNSSIISRLRFLPESSGNFKIFWFVSESNHVPESHTYIWMFFLFCHNFKTTVYWDPFNSATMAMWHNDFSLHLSLWGLKKAFCKVHLGQAQTCQLSQFCRESRKFLNFSHGLTRRLPISWFGVRESW